MFIGTIFNACYILATTIHINFCIRYRTQFLYTINLESLRTQDEKLSIFYFKVLLTACTEIVQQILGDRCSEKASIFKISVRFINNHGG